MSPFNRRIPFPIPPLVFPLLLAAMKAISLVMPIRHLVHPKEEYTKAGDEPSQQAQAIVEFYLDIADVWLIVQ